MHREAKHFNALRRLSLHEQLAEDLGIRILSGQFLPGEALPAQPVLAASLHVSKTPVREAMQMLSAKGLVEVRRKTGILVRPRKDWNALDPDVIAWQFSGVCFPSANADCLTLRRIVEPAAARLAAAEAKAEDIDEIGTAIASMELASGNIAAAVEADIRFHLAVLEASHNLFMRPFGPLIRVAERSNLVFNKTGPVAFRDSVERRRKVLDAIRSCSPSGAEAAMQDVLRERRWDVDRSLDSQSEPERTAKMKRSNA